MPLSDFKCDDCGTIFELYHSNDDWAARTIPCAECGSTHLGKYFGNSNVGIVHNVTQLNKLVPTGMKDVLKSIKGGAGRHANETTFQSI
jgi:putative FmdB family regulatory protein